MIEAVGHEYMEEFFGCCDSALADDGLLVLQVFYKLVILLSDHLLLNFNAILSFKSCKYIFYTIIKLFLQSKSC
jgi:spermidine synthase